MKKKKYKYYKCACNIRSVGDPVEWCGGLYRWHDGAGGEWYFVDTFVEDQWIEQREPPNPKYIKPIDESEAFIELL